MSSALEYYTLVLPNNNFTSNLMTSGRRIDSFDLKSGSTIARKYQIVSQLGSGWEGEVYIVRERSTNIERAAKLFYPQRNPNHKTSKVYARRIHSLRECSIIIPYHAHEDILYKGHKVTCLVSDYVEGESLKAFLAKQPGKRLSLFQSLHLLYSLIRGVEEIHAKSEYHGDLHSENVLVRKYGLNFDLKVLDLYDWGGTNTTNRQDDICDAIKLFYEALGGARTYKSQPKCVKFICAGLKKGILKKRFPTATRLRQHLESIKLQ